MRERIAPERGATTLELVGVLLLAAMSICVIVCQTATPIEIAYTEAAAAMGGSTEGTIADPSGVKVAADPLP